MRWKTELKPNTGDRRLRQCFAFTPTETDDGYTVWLEHFWVEEEFFYCASEGTGFWSTKKTLLNHPDRPDTGGNNIRL
jgi:hypothetical protein